MKIEKIIWMDEDSREAEVIVTDGLHHCLTFCHPCDFKESQEITDVLHPLSVEELMISYEEFVKINIRCLND